MTLLGSGTPVFVFGTVEAVTQLRGRAVTRGVSAAQLRNRVTCIRLTSDVRLALLPPAPRRPRCRGERSHARAAQEKRSRGSGAIHLSLLRRRMWSTRLPSRRTGGQHRRRSGVADLARAPLSQGRGNKDR